MPYSYGSTTVTTNNAGNIVVATTGGDPMIYMQNLSTNGFDKQNYHYFQVRYKVLSGTPGSCELYFYFNGGNLDESHVVRGALIGDNNWHVLTIDASQYGFWAETTITGWRFDFCTSAGVNMEIDYIALTNVSHVGSTYEFSNPSVGAHTVYADRFGECHSGSCATKTVTVHALPTLNDPINKTQTVCSGSAIQEIAFTYDNATSLQATNLPNGLSFGNNKITGTPTANGTYTVTTVNDHGCADSSRQGTITVIPNITLIDGVTDRGNIANCYTIDPEDNFVNKEGDIVSYPALTEYGDTVRGCSCDVVVTLDYRTPTTASVKGRVRMFEPTTASHAYAYTTEDCSGTPIEASSLSVNGKFVTAVFSGLSENTKYYFKILATNGTKQAEGVSEAY